MAKKKGLRLAIVSTQQNSITIPLLEKYKMNNLFFNISGAAGDKAEALKEIFLSAKIPPQEAVYVGDQKGDVLSAKKAGCISVFYSGGIHGRERLGGLNPDFIIDKISDLKNLPIFW